MVEGVSPENRGESLLRRYLPEVVAGTSVVMIVLSAVGGIWLW